MDKKTIQIVKSIAGHLNSGLFSLEDCSDHINKVIAVLGVVETIEALNKELISPITINQLRSKYANSK